MFESHATNQKLPPTEALLVVNRKSYSILIHEITGDHIYDHIKGVAF